MSKEFHLRRQVKSDQYQRMLLGPISSPALVQSWEVAVPRRPLFQERRFRSGYLSGSLWEVALQHSRKQVFCPDDLINLFLVDFRWDLCQGENQHSSCGR